MAQSPTLSPTTPSMPMLHYGVWVVGTATIVLVIYNLIILVKWRSYFSNPRSRSSTDGSSFKYKRDEDGGGEAYSECVVCLSVFEEGEELRKLPKCNHSFHASCIDTWLYSHTDCPLCRCTVELPGVKRRPENYPRVLLVPVPLV